MFLGFFLFYAVLFAVVIATATYGVGWAIKKQANKPQKRFFAPIPRPNRFSFITLEGKVVDVAENIGGWELETQKDGSRCFVPDKKRVQAQPTGVKESIEHLLREKLGVICLWFFLSIKIFPEWEWLELQIKEEEGELKYEVKQRRESVEDFLFQFPYPVIMDDVEINENIRVKVVAQFIVWHLNPIRAFFLNADSASLFSAMIQSAFRNFVADKGFNDVKQMKATPPTQKEQPGDFWTVLDKLNGLKFMNGIPDYENADPSGLFGKLGFYVVRGEITQVEAVGEAAKAIEAENIAELNAKAKIAEARGEQEAMKVRLNTRAEWVQKTIVDPTGGAGPHVAEVLKAELVAGGSSKIQTWVEGDRIVGHPAQKRQKTIISIPTK
jgi:regulator of protease activity HflC (stomatin/prohibitin superfamily)